MAWLDLEAELSDEFAEHAGTYRYAEALEKYRSRRLGVDASGRRERRQLDCTFLARERRSRREYLARHRDDERVQAGLKAASARHYRKRKCTTIASVCAVCGASFSAPATAARVDGCSPAHRRALSRGYAVATVNGVRDTVFAHAKRLGIHYQSIADHVSRGVRTAAEALLYIIAKRGAL